MEQGLVRTPQKLHRNTVKMQLLPVKIGHSIDVEARLQVNVLNHFGCYDKNTETAV
jgi:hypothetical protein